MSEGRVSQVLWGGAWTGDVHGGAEVGKDKLQVAHDAEQDAVPGAQQVHQAWAHRGGQHHCGVDDAHAHGASAMLLQDETRIYRQVQERGQVIDLQMVSEATASSLVILASASSTVAGAPSWDNSHGMTLE